MTTPPFLLRTFESRKDAVGEITVGCREGPRERCSCPADVRAPAKPGIQSCCPTRCVMSRRRCGRSAPRLPVHRDAEPPRERRSARPWRCTSFRRFVTLRGDRRCATRSQLNGKAMHWSRYAEGGVAQSGSVERCASQGPQRDAGATGTGAGPPRMREARAGPSRMIAKKSPLVTISAAGVECGRPVAVAAPQECGLPRPDRPGPAVPAPGPVRR